MSNDVTRGILAMLVAVACFAVMDAALKQLVGTYPALQVSCLRGLASIPFFLVGIAITRQWRDILPRRWGQHLLRGGLAVIMLVAFIYSVSQLPLGSAYGIFLCGPLLITAISALVLRERVSAHQWLAIVLGLIGVMVILNPSGKDMVTFAGLAALISALCYAIAALMIRSLAQTDTTLSIAMSFLVIIAVCTGIAAYPNWVPLVFDHWPWILILGISGSLGQYLLIYAFKHAAASVVAPLEYTALLWGIGFDWVLWSTVPSARMLVGAGVVVSSGLYLIYGKQWFKTAPPIVETPP